MAKNKKFQKPKGYIMPVTCYKFLSEGAKNSLHAHLPLNDTRTLTFGKTLLFGSLNNITKNA